ncbi:hypothetical protein GCM10027079_11060 [Sediminivirga luteola]|uniref:Uncharacterized protein n=1 Tax=Sediminivirga luteola TaxID=1774748 RepID=A0A8J2XLK1_9MICO|nr:hypothetical protein GCM10011333_22500 [Sediminivirga luteola]
MRSGSLPRERGQLAVSYKTGIRVPDRAMSMSIDVPRARTFMTTHARVLDRHRFEAVTTGSAHARRAIIDALGAYRNPYGGYG